MIDLVDVRIVDGVFFEERDHLANELKGWFGSGRKSFGLIVVHSDINGLASGHDLDCEDRPNVSKDFSGLSGGYRSHRNKVFDIG